MTKQQVTTRQARTMSSADGFTQFIGAGAWAAILSGLALAASLLLEWLVLPYEQLGQTETLLTRSYLLSAGLRLLSTILLLWALIALYARQSRAAGTFGLWAFVVAFLGTALQAGETWAEVFAFPTLGQAAPGLWSGQTTETSSYLVSAIFLSAVFLGLGWILFGASMFSARVYPRWAGVLLIVSIPVTIILGGQNQESGTFVEAIGQIMFGIAVAALGFYALRIAPSSTSSEGWT